MPNVELIKITKRYDNVVANDNINLAIKDGEYVSVIGPSGCGKTTLIKNIAGIIKPDSGDIFIDGKRVNDQPIEDRGIGYVFQNIALFPHMNIWDNVTYGPKVKGWSQKESTPLVKEMLDMIQLSTRVEAYPSELSGGMQQKTAVARALTSRAELLLLDEPLGALDVKVRAKLRYELRRLVKDLHLTALHVTHDQEEAMSISDRVIVMRKGKIVEIGTPFDLYIHPKNIFTANFVGEANFLEGTIAHILEEGSIVDLKNGLRLRVTIKNHKIDDHVVIVFRPEFGVIRDKDDNKTFNRLSGNVIEILYSGNIVRYKVKLVNNATIVFTISLSIQDPKLSVGDNLSIYVPPEHILTYPYPKGGLSKELSLE
ncbi:MAG: ABC transporter ATP-binding protein [Candidatus Bathyarchaeota archaeon]|nr:MAG: ABC transporter ATP-binding protein [Candidatus Bathyarchaeota archaeon]